LGQTRKFPALQECPVFPLQADIRLSSGKCQEWPFFDLELSADLLVLLSEVEKVLDATHGGNGLTA
jgi:hypothetical protein